MEDAWAAAIQDAHLGDAAAQPAVRRRRRSVGGDVRMTPLFRLRRRTRIAARHFARSTRCAVMLEMAFAIPFPVPVGFGGLEIATLTLPPTRVSTLWLITAANAARLAAGSHLPPAHGPLVCLTR